MRKGEITMHTGQQLMIRRAVEDGMFMGRTTKKKKIDWVSAEVAYIPSHGRLVSFRFKFRTVFGQQNSYRESYFMDDIVMMMQKGEIREV